MAKNTTAQVAKAVGITKLRLYQILGDNPTLRPVERSDKPRRYLWSDDELEALQVYLTCHPLRAYKKRRPHL